MQANLPSNYMQNKKNILFMFLNYYKTFEKDL